VYIVWAGEKVRPEYDYASPTLDQRQELSPGIHAVPLLGLVQMKLLSNRDQDRVHLRDMIDVGLVDRDLLGKLPKSLAERLEPLQWNSGDSTACASSCTNKQCCSLADNLLACHDIVIMPYHTVLITGKLYSSRILETTN
jgi:hypothetical protein